MVHHPRHYNVHPSGVECIDVVEWLGFNRGNAVKYLWRKDDKGKHTEDTQKALWYTTREIERRMTDASFWELEPVPDYVQDKFDLWFDEEPAGWRRDAVSLIYTGTLQCLREARDVLVAQV